MTREIWIAISLMRVALDLFDRAGESDAAVRLQHAIDTATRAPVPGRVNRE